MSSAVDTRPAWQRIERPGRRMVFRYTSAALGDEVEITVIPPIVPPAGGGPAPVLYVLDPFLTLDTVAGWAAVYGRYANGAVPPAYVIGVGHPTDDEPRFMALRVRDLTPTPVTGRQWNPPLGAGQGPRFLAALRDEVVPFVAQTFPVSDDRTLIGWSLGGLFTLYALFQEPRLFQRHLVVSPSLWWGDRLPLQWEQAWAAGHSDLDARVFMAVGAREQDPGGGWLSEDFSDDLIAWFSQVTNFRTFVRRLKARSYPNLTLDSSVFADEYHMTVYPGAVARGLVRLFARSK